MPAGRCGGGGANTPVGLGGLDDAESAAAPPATVTIPMIAVTPATADTNKARDQPDDFMNALPIEHPLCQPGCRRTSVPGEAMLSILDIWDDDTRIIRLGP
jgi:hypothetical protein